MSVLLRVIFVVIFVSVLGVLAPVIFTDSAHAQQFLPIGNGNVCVRFANGNEYLGVKNGENYTIVKSAPVIKSLVLERSSLKKRLATVKAIAAQVKSTNPPKTTLQKFSALLRPFTEGGILPFLGTIPERQEAVSFLLQSMQTRLKAVNQYIADINKCNEGSIKPPKDGEFLFPTVKLIGLKGTREAYAGFMLILAAEKNKFSKKPTGFNGCLKLYYPDGEILGLYTGFGSEACYGSPGIFETATAACNAVLTKGQVGYPLQKAQSSDTSDAGVNALVDLVKDSGPQAVFLRFPVDLSRDKSVKICDQFLNK